MLTTNVVFGTNLASTTGSVWPVREPMNGLLQAVSGLHKVNVRLMTHGKEVASENRNVTQTADA